MSSDQRFFDPIILPGREPLVTLRDAALHITKLPKAEHDAAEWQAAMEALLLVAESDGPTMARRTAIMNHWFVSVDTPKQQGPVSSRAPSARQIKSFPTENEAKQFAKVMLAEGIKATAGTLSPHKPIRRTITASEIHQWIEEDK